MAPEVKRGNYSFNADLFSFAITAVEFVYPFGSESEKIAYLGERPVKLPGDFVTARILHISEDEVTNMLALDPNSRPTTRELRGKQCSDNLV